MRMKKTRKKTTGKKAINRALALFFYAFADNIYK